MIKTMTKKPFGEETFYFISQLSLPTEGSQGREPEAETEAKAEKQYLLIHSVACFSNKMEAHLQQLALLTVGWALPHQPLHRKMPHGPVCLDESNSSAEVPPPR